MSKVEELRQEIQDLQDRLHLKEQENNLLKKELISQLNLRETELTNLSKLLKKQSQLEKKYLAIRNSSLGKVTIKYWNVRKKLIGSRREGNQ